MAERDLPKRLLEQGDGPYLWAPSWLALAWCDNGDLLAIDCGPEAENASPVYFVQFEPLRPAEARSIGEVVTWWLDAFESGAYFLNELTGAINSRFELLPRDRAITGIV